MKRDEMLSRMETFWIGRDDILSLFEDEDSPLSEAFSTYTAKFEEPIKSKINDVIDFVDNETQIKFHNLDTDIIFDLFKINLCTVILKDSLNSFFSDHDGYSKKDLIFEAKIITPFYFSAYKEELSKALFEAIREAINCIPVGSGEESCMHYYVIEQINEKFFK